MGRSRALYVQNRDRLRRRFSRDRDRVESLAILAPLLTPYTPWSSSAMTPMAIRELCNDVVVNDRRTVLELGAGVSSIVLCRLADQLDLDVRVHSVDESDEWLERIDSLLSAGERDHWTPIYAPMTSGRLEDGTSFNRWYEPTAVRDGLTGPVDLVVCDGPSAYLPEWQDDRSTAMPFALSVVAERYAVLVDDTDRGAERQMAERWAARTPGSYFADRTTHCWIVVGGSLNIS